MEDESKLNAHINSSYQPEECPVEDHESITTAESYYIDMNTLSTSNTVSIDFQDDCNAPDNSSPDEVRDSEDATNVTYIECRPMRQGDITAQSSSSLLTEIFAFLQDESGTLDEVNDDEYTYESISSFETQQYSRSVSKNNLDATNDSDSEFYVQIPVASSEIRIPSRNEIIDTLRLTAKERKRVIVQFPDASSDDECSIDYPCQEQVMYQNFQSTPNNQQSHPDTESEPDEHYEVIGDERDPLISDDIVDNPPTVDSDGEPDYETPDVTIVKYENTDFIRFSILPVSKQLVDENSSDSPTLPPRHDNINDSNTPSLIPRRKALSLCDNNPPPVPPPKPRATSVELVYQKPRSPSVLADVQQSTLLEEQDDASNKKELTPEIPGKDVITEQPTPDEFYEDPKRRLRDVEKLYFREGDRLIYDFEKIAFCWGDHGGLDIGVENQVPEELAEKGITLHEWYGWMSELREVQKMSPTYTGLSFMCCCPLTVLQTIFCVLCCPLSMNHPLKCLPCCHGDWYEGLHKWTEQVNRVLNKIDMYAKLMTYKPYTVAPMSRSHAGRIVHRCGSCYEMSFLVIALTEEESKRLMLERWDHGTNGKCLSCVGRNV